MFILLIHIIYASYLHIHSPPLGRRSSIENALIAISNAYYANMP